jgi:hypothetical protein
MAGRTPGKMEPWADPNMAALRYAVPTKPSFDGTLPAVVFLLQLNMGADHMQIELPPELEPFVEQEFATGR